MLETLTPASFKEHVGSRFRLSLAGQEPLELELGEIVLYEENPDHAPRKVPFSLILLGPARPLLPQAIYRLEHAVLGALELFVVPIGPGKRGMQYEITFN
jgi:hypothetical protein